MSTRRTVFEKVTNWIKFDAVKHSLWQSDYGSVEDYVEAKINSMTPFQLLNAISEALEND